MIYTVTFNPAIDYVVRLDASLEVGQVNRACGEDCVLGGKGINVSGVLAQLGCPSVALGFVAGETGAWLERGASGKRHDPHQCQNQGGAGDRAERSWAGHPGRGPAPAGRKAGRSDLK